MNIRLLAAAVAALLLSFSLGLPGCQSSAGTGALAGGGIGALAGQAIGGNTTATLVGAAVGAGVGYVVGNEVDKAEAKKISEESKDHGYTHTDVGPLGGTRWLVVSLNPQDFVPEYTSKIIEFRPYGRVITTTTNPDGSVDVEDERYRVVNDTLIVNRNDFIINAKYRFDGERLILNANEFSAVLRKMAS